MELKPEYESNSGLNLIKYDRLRLFENFKNKDYVNRMLRLDNDHWFFKHIQPGRSIILVARSMYPQWRTFVRSAMVVIAGGPTNL